MFLISWYIFTHDNSPSTAVRRYISLGFTHNVTKRLATFGYIEKEETTLALKALEEEYAGKCYMWPAKNKDGKEKDKSGKIYINISQLKN